MICRSCGATNAPDARFCSQCGTSQATADEERRVVSVVFADIVGFTSLSERRDPEDVKHLVDRCFARLTENITAFGGVVDKIVGDAIVALFGAPIAHEDDAERAVRAALAMRAELEDMLRSEEAGDQAAIRMRIGVNTGEVLVGSTTAGGDYTAMGDVMNSAARLEQMAEPGQVLVGAATKAATDHAVRYEPAGTLAAKGRDEPIQAWIAIEATRPPGEHRVRSATFVGRDRELSLLEAQGALALEQGRAQVGIVVGEAGMGKSRLVHEAATRLAGATDAAVYEARCVPYGEANVWWPVAELLRAMFNLNRDLGQADVELRLRSLVAKRFADLSTTSTDRLQTALLHTMGYLTELRGGDRTHNRAEVTDAFATVVENELNHRPVMIVLSDLHWASDAVWGVLDRTMTLLSRRRFLLLATARSIEPATEGSLEPNTLLTGRHSLSVVHLGPLSTAAASSLLGELHLNIGEETIDELVARSGGNPFFLEELAGLMQQTGRRSGGDRTQPVRSRLSADGLRDLPDTLRGIVAARLDGLDPDQRAVIEDASVLGSSGTLASLSMLFGRRNAGLGAGQTGGLNPASEVDRFERSLQDLVEDELLASDGSRFEFRSNLVRDVAYGTLTKTARAERHFEIASHVEERDGRNDHIRGAALVAIADHYRAAAQLSAELGSVPSLDQATVVSKALYWTEQAGDRALKAGEPAEAERWYSIGLDLSGDDETLATFVLGRAKARCEVHDLAGSRSDLSRLEPLIEGNAPRSADAMLTKGDVLRKAGDLNAAAALLREAAARLAALRSPSKQALALRLLGLTEMARLDDSMARQALDASRRVAAAAQDRRGEAWALQSMAWHAFARGRVLEAGALAAQAIELFVRLGDRGGLAWAQAVQAWVAFHLGQWDTARELLDTILPETRRRSDPWAEAIMVSLASSLALWSGRAAEGMALAQEAEGLALKAEDKSLRVQALALQGRAFVSLGRIADGNRTLNAAFAQADADGHPDTRQLAIIANCASAARLGESARAMRWAARFDGTHEDPTVVGQADLIVAVTLALLQRGAVDEARGQLSWVDAAEPLPEEGTIDYYAEAVRGVIAAADGRLDDVEESVARVLTTNATYLDRTMAFLAKAAARIQVGDVSGCDAALSEARAQIEPTDDRFSRYVVNLVAAICGRDVALPEARAAMRRAGIDPTGLEMMWSTAARQPTSHSS